MHATVFEYGCLCSEAEGKVYGFTLISPESFEYLEQLCLGPKEREIAQLLQLRVRHGMKVLQVNNYVGVLHTPTGEQIEVLPKVGKRSDCIVKGVDESRDMLLTMLKRLADFRFLESSNSSVQSRKMPLLDVFIAQFLGAVNDLVKRGLKSDYVSVQDNLAYQKGKLLVSKQLRHNVVNKHKFYVEYDEFLQDRPANRLIRTALRKLSSLTLASQNQRLLRELEFTFADVPFSTSIKQDFMRIKVDRGMSYYQAPLAWSKIILDGLSPLSMKGDSEALSLLFPMEAVFESYVASVLRDSLPDGFELSTQARSEYLVSHNKRSQFMLKPDLIFTKPDKVQIVLDTKWKLVDVNAHNYGLSQSDFYQMFAYGHKYLPKEGGDLILIYPAHDEFEKPVEHSFDFSESLKLWVVPFKIDVYGKCRVIWPESLSPC
ncbi:McrC family protein [Vibrio genomosp. F10 str. 9ZC157]|uniref:Restriction endonuclease n=1 Tax=Vibrio genomosp. F10 str. ZF-129 TaxID=1187848 RepID=A0A1E5BCP1_9VIBR|nr:McrC family protein [Vibrio genomosp. F10]OEE32344.1 restriction endonuclease [Vibrio genomosp. F10 str. ZF-129]OEE96864.1 restriction endonuclease [Vibrio genomosp. F10 str. 9ZC157]